MQGKRDLSSAGIAIQQCVIMPTCVTTPTAGITIQKRPIIRQKRPIQQCVIMPTCVTTPTAGSAIQQCVTMPTMQEQEAQTHAQVQEDEEEQKMPTGS